MRISSLSFCANGILLCVAGVIKSYLITWMPKNGSRHKMTSDLFDNVRKRCESVN